MSLGAQVEKYRAIAGLQYRELADLSGVDIGTINALEKRKSKRSEHGPALARAMGLTVEQLLDAEADHSGLVLAHIAAARSSQRKPGDEAARRVGEVVAKYTTGQPWPFKSVTPEQVQTLLSGEDLERIEAYAQAVMDMRAAQLKKDAA